MKWQKKKCDAKIVKLLMKQCKITELQATLLVNRGIVDFETANKYLYATLADLYDVYLLKDVQKATDIIVQTIRNKEKITIYGDYDCDGVTASAVGFRGLKNLGANVDFYLPHRQTEGYGMNVDAIQKIADMGTKLIITVDNGIAATKEVELAKKLGMKIIVTDHHDVPFNEKDNGKKEYIIPNADAIINPKQIDCKYPNKGLCGCALIWRVLEVVYEKMCGDLDFYYNLLGLVALGTVSDMMDLVDENRILVKEGLMSLNEGIFPGIISMKEVFKVEEVTSETIGFRFGPMLNADGRLYNAKTAVELLIEDDKAKADEHAKFLFEANEERKEMTVEAVERAIRNIEENGLKENYFLVLFDKEIPEGLVGLVAGRIKERYEVPTLVFTEGEEYYKASGRGIEGHPLSLFDTLQKVKHLWEKGGGHKMACGVSIKKDMNIMKQLSLELNEITKTALNGDKFVPTLMIDDVIDNPDETLCREISILEPVGKSNPKATFITNVIDVEEAKPVGDGSHISFKFTDKRKGIGFSQTYKYQEIKAPLRLKVAYSPVIEKYAFEGKDGKMITGRSVKMHIIDMQSLQQVTSSSMLISSFKSCVNK